jgi:hypothetical protein
MKSMRAYLIFWLSGAIAGIILMERWRRHGGRYVPAEPVAAPDVGVPPSRPPTAVANTASVVGQVVAGAKLDAERVVQRLRPSKDT